MSSNEGRLLEEYWDRWEWVWERDRWSAEYREQPWDEGGEDVYFDLEEGELLCIDPIGRWTMVEENESTANLKRIEADPERYERIEPLSHAQHHELFREFLETLDPDLTGRCNKRSIGGFFDDCGTCLGPCEAMGVRRQWEKFRADRFMELATEWLRQRGWKVRWR